MTIKVTAVHGSGKAGQTRIAKDGAHADRMIAKLKAALPKGSSTHFKRESV